VSILVH